MNLVEYKKANETFLIREETSDLYVVNECYTNMYFKPRMDYNKNDVILDVGCNIGAYSTRVSKFVKEVVSFEPDAENYSIALQNLKNNGADNVTLHNYALVGNDDGEIKFYINGLKNKGMHSIIETRGREFVTVKTKRFSTMLKESKANKVKLDVEGAEWDIFNNDTIDWSGVDKLVMEWHQSKLRDKTQEKLNWTVEYLKKHFTTVDAPKPTLKSWTSIIYASK